MARKVSVGVLGIGTVAELFYLEAIVKHGDRAELTALCDVAPGRAQAAADKWGAKAAFADLGEMLASTGRRGGAGADQAQPALRARQAGARSRQASRH